MDGKYLLFPHLNWRPLVNIEEKGERDEILQLIFACQEISFGFLDHEQ
jgi:hypothetical protein